MALTGKRIFVTGGAGFIGTTLARELVDENTVVAFDNLHRNALEGTDLADHPNFELIEGDILDAAAVRDAAVGATHIVHCAAIAGVDTVLASPVRTMRVNVIGTYNVLEAALGDARHARALRRLLDERGLRHPRASASRRARSRRSARSARRAGRTPCRSSPASTWRTPTTTSSACPTVTVHPFNVFGPGQIGGGAIRAFSEAALAGRDLTIHGDGSQIRAWCYVTDMVSGVLACLERPEAVGQAFNIGNPRSAVTIYDLAQRIKRLTGAPARSSSSRSTTPTSSCASRTSRRRASCSAGSRRSSSTTASKDDRVVPGEADRIRLGWPELGAAELAAVEAVLDRAAC